MRLQSCLGKTKDEWLPITKLGCLVRDVKIKSLEEIYLISLPIKESEIIDFLLGASLEDEFLRLCLCKSRCFCCPGTRFKAFVSIRGCYGHVGLGVKCSKTIATAFRGAIILAKLFIGPVP